MSRTNYGIIGSPNVTVSLITTTQEDEDFEFARDTGTVFPEPQVKQRRHNYNLGRMKQEIEASVLFPVSS